MTTKPRIAILVGSLALVLAVTAPRAGTAAQDGVPPEAAEPLRVKAAYAFKSKSDTKGTDPIRLSRPLALELSGPDALVGGIMKRCRELRLVFAGEAFSEALRASCRPANLVVFNLGLVDRADEPAWQNLLATRSGTKARAEVSLQLADEEPLESRAVDREIVLYNEVWGLVALIGLVLVLLGFIRLARESNMLRDGGPKLAGTTTQRPYSLARVQTAWWFFLVLTSFIVISLLKGSLVVIPGTILGLMGIAAGTFLGAELVDSGSRARAGDEGKRQPAVASRHRLGFFLDIFSDASGVTFHRFQMFVWTLALGVFFIIKMLLNLEMPEFDGSILGLMGISSGTYLGMKIPEQPKGDGGADPAPPAAGENAGQS